MSQSPTQHQTQEQRVQEFFLHAALLAPEMSFILGGEGWRGKTLPSNVRWIGHVASGSHNRVNCSARMVLNINRDSMAQVGFSPPTRVFEASAAGACVITDVWDGIEGFFAPGLEILPAVSAHDVVRYLRLIGAAAEPGALPDHHGSVGADPIRRASGAGTCRHDGRGGAPNGCVATTRRGGAGRGRVRRQARDSIPRLPGGRLGRHP